MVASLPSVRMKSEDTPLMQQWREVKARHPDALVFFRVGDFYELFNEDAEEGARLLGLTLTSRNNGSSRAPLAGVPAHSLQLYLHRLIGHGRRVAICDQMEDPAQAKGIVRREVTETVTPGTVYADALLDARRNNFLAALSGDPGGDADLGLAYADLSTGEMIATRVSRGELAGALARVEPAELLLPRSWEVVQLPETAEAPRVYRPDWLFEVAAGREAMIRRFGVLSLEGFGISRDDDLIVGACGALLGFLAEVQPAGVQHLRPPRIEHRGDAMPLDEMTRRNLELVEPLRSGDRGGTLIGILDDTLTPMGARLLRRWLLSPLVRLEPILRRQEAVSLFHDDGDLRRRTRAALGAVRDLERLASRIATARAAPRELLALANSLGQVPELRDAVAGCTAPLVRQLHGELDPLEPLRQAIERGIHPDAPAQLAEGGLIRAGFSAELDELRQVRDGAVDWIARMQTRERERTGISSLKVGFNKVFGYYIEITRANLERAPDDYFRKQTLANAERFVTPELKEWEEKVLGAEERIGALELRLLSEIRAEVAGEVRGIQALSEAIAVLDLLAALAEVAVRRNYVRPALDSGFALDIVSGRHPVVETMMPRSEFIPNDVRLVPAARIMILTGPNMAGKSTVLRQVGLIVLLAQIGSFVPAEAASLGVVDRIFTRVGASDNLVRGQSTFMVEMNETAAILHGATARSLVLLDEIGRGTSTWDGLSVATAATEYLHDHIGAKTIFATHYHELTRLSERLPGVVNCNVAVHEEDESIVFLRRLIAGGADRSYGVEVARLAGLPRVVVARARELLHQLENGRNPDLDRVSERDPAHLQLPLFEPPAHPAVERLRQVEVNEVTPLQALNILAQLVEAARA
jgi:DNA mismatch repair protein MutS